MLRAFLFNIQRPAISIQRQNYSTASLGIAPEDIGQDAREIIERLSEAGFQAWVVGGGVRDLLLGEKPKDFDVATTARPDEVLRLFRRSRKIGRRFTIVHVVSRSPRGRDRSLPQQFTEVATLRGAPKRMDSNGKILDDNRWSRRLEDDVVRRDLSINALYLDPIKGELLDFTGGVEDMRNKQLRVVGEPVRRFREDPVRILRLVRFQVRHGFTVGDEELAAVDTCCEALASVDSARMQGEVEKMLLSGRGVATVEALESLQLMDYLVPGWSERVSTKEPNDARQMFFLALERADDRVEHGEKAYWGDLLTVFLWPAYCKAVSGCRSSTERMERAVALLQHQGRQVAVFRREQDDILAAWRAQTPLEKERVPEGMLRRPGFVQALQLAELRRRIGDPAMADFERRTWLERHREAKAAAPPPEHSGRGRGGSRGGSRGGRRNRRPGAARS